MPGLAQRNNKQFSNAYSVSANGFWSKHSDDVSFNQLQKFWSGLTPQERQELLRIDKQTLFEQARKNLYCSRCNGLLLEGFSQIVKYGKSLQQDGGVAQLPCNRRVASKNENDSGLTMINGCQDDIQDPSVLPWGGLSTTRDGSLTVLDCYLCSKYMKGLQNVFDSACARERERELLYPDACGGGGRGWMSQGMTSFGRGHGIRETCALHTARLSCDTLVDFWSALGEETRLSLLSMEEEDFIDRLKYRFDSKRFCRDCRRNVIREFKELKRVWREPRCTSWFCVADTAFQYEVSDDTVQADWCQTFADTVGTYHHFEWAVGTGEGKSDILEFENVGMNGSVKVSGLDLSSLSACFITLRAWKLDGRCTELSVKAHALKGQQCVHYRLVVSDGYVTITKGESIRRFFDHAEEAEEEEDDDSMGKDGNELDGECTRPQKHAKSPELAREFLLDAATVIFKEQVEKAFREGTARQNAHSIFVCLALKLLEERVHVACKEIITLEKQKKLLEEEEKEKREEEERKERRRMKEREKKLRRKERLKGKERDKENKSSSSDQGPVITDVLKEESSASFDEEPSNVSETGDVIVSRPGSPDIQDEQFSSGCMTSRMENYSYDSPDGDVTSVKDGNGAFQMEQSKFSRRRSKFRKEVQLDSPLKWSDRCRYAVVSDNGSVANRSESRYHSDNYETPRAINGSNRQLWINASKSSFRNCSGKFNEKIHCSNNRTSDIYDFHSCSCIPQNEYRAKDEPHVSATRVGREPKSVSKSEYAPDMSKQFYGGNKYNQMDYMRDASGRTKSKIIIGNNPFSRDSLYAKKVWEPMESQKKYPRSNSDSDVSWRSTAFKGEGVEHGNNLVKSSVEMCANGASRNSGDMDLEDDNMKKSRDSSHSTDGTCQNGCGVEAKGSFYSTEAAFDKTGLCHTRNSTLNGISDPIMGGSSNSDNCSSCLSEGDSNTVSSNHGNLESSSTSDSEDAGQQSEGRDTSACTQNGFSKFQEVGMEKKQNTNGGETLGRRAFGGLPPDSLGSNFPGNLPAKTAQNLENGIPTVSIGSQKQAMYPPIHNQNIQISAFQPPTTMGYYHQNPVSWSSAPANGLMPFTHPYQFRYAGPLGYGLNGSSRLCMQYGALQHVATPVFNPTLVPVYKPIAKANGMEEQTHIGRPAAAQETFNDTKAERVAPARSHLSDAPSKGEGGHHDNDSFSLFQFGGPVALSTGCKVNPVSSKDEIVGNFSSQGSADHAENDHSCNKKETIIEEYNLFAASDGNGLRFSFF